MMEQKTRWLALACALVALGLVLFGAFTVKARSPQGILTACTVASTADSGPGTLRACLESAQAGDTITFDPAVFPPGSPATIALTSGPLPEIWQGNLTLDATEAGVILDGSALTSGNGLDIGSDGNVIQGLQILYFPENGVRLWFDADNNLIGGINSTPGGPCSGQCNVISGNGWLELFRGDCGVLVHGTGNTVSGNYIGTDASGTQAIPNGNGVMLWSAMWNTVGGEVEGSGNLISGNDNSHGVWIWDGTGNYVVGNLIGTDANGSSRLWNVLPVGIYWDSKDNILEGNVITGDFFGIQIALPGATGNVIRGNWIGTNADGDDLGNSSGGIELTSSAGHNVIGPGNVIRYNDGAGIALNHEAYGNLVSNNDIFDNAAEGVSVSGSSTLTNTLTQNSIHANGGPGIDLVDGGNAELPAPIVTSVNLTAGAASGMACPNCTVEVFSDDEDEGQWYEGTVTADAAGAWFIAKGSAFTGLYVTATATDAEGNTSEFSVVFEYRINLPVVMRTYP